MTKPALSVQLYTVGKEFGQDSSGTLKRLSEMGLKNVEGVAIDQDPAGVRALMDQYGLSMPSAHMGYIYDHIDFGGNIIPAVPWDQLVAAAETLGVTYLIDPAVSPAKWASKEDVDESALRLNEIAKKVEGSNLTVGYHNHSFEFHHDIEGQSAYEYFVGQLDPSVVLELDAYWAGIAGQDVPALLGRLGDRVKLMHLKDGTFGEDPLLPDNMGNSELIVQYAAGQGDVPIEAILDAAPGLELAVIEFDNYRGDIFEGVADSVVYLNSLGVN